MRVGVLFAVAAFVALTLNGCSSGSNLPPLPQADNSETAYHLGAGDKLRITVFGAEDLSGDFSVADNGILSFPLIGDVEAAGLTPGQLAHSVRAKLANGFMRDPRVSIQVTTYRPFSIFGEVTRPGEYPYAAGMTVLNAVALGGGYSYRANQDYVVVTRGHKEYRGAPDSHILAGDIIRVPERYF